MSLSLSNLAIDKTVRDAVNKAIETHRRLGQPIVVMRDGKVIWIAPEDIPPLIEIIEQQDARNTRIEVCCPGILVVVIPAEETKRRRTVNFKQLSRLILTATFVLCAVSARAQEQPQKPWQMPAADKTELLQVFNMLAPGDAWKVTNTGNEFIIEHIKPVNFYYFLPGGPPGKEPSKIPSTEQFRVTFRFQPLISNAQYKKYEIENRVIERQHGKLLDKYKINQKFDQYSLFGDDASERAKGYRAEAAELKSQLLPQFYNLEYSITAFQSWHFLRHVNPNSQDEGTQECEEILGKMRRLLGTYEPRYAHNEWFAYPEDWKTKPIYPAELTIYEK